MIESYANEWPVLSECVLSLYQRTLCRLNWIVRCVCARVRREPHLSEWQIFYSYVPLDALHTQSISSFFLYCFILCGFSCWFFVVVVTSAHVLVVVARSSMRNQVKTNGFHKNKRWKRDCRTNEPEERDHGCVAIGQQRFLLLFHYVLGYVLVSSPAFDLWRNENVRKTWGTEEDAAAWRGKDEERMCNGIIVVNHTHKGIYVHSHMIDRPWGERKWWRQIDDWQITFAMSVCSQMLLLLWWPTLETWHRAPAMKKKSKPHDHWSTHALQSYLIHDLLPIARRRFELKIENKNWIDHEFVEFVFMVS